MQNISIPDPVLWFEGMPLLPHHFQQEFLYHQAISHMQFQICGGFNYGILELEIDTLSLIRNIFKINKVFALLPDGILIKIDNHPHYNLEYILPDPVEFEKNKLALYLTIPKIISNNYFVGKYPRYRKEQYFDKRYLNQAAGFRKNFPSFDKAKIAQFLSLKLDRIFRENFLIILG